MSACQRFILAGMVWVFVAASALGAGFDLCDRKELESIPVQTGGRVKPLLVHAEETMKFITGSKKVGSYSATNAYCRLALAHFLPVDAGFTPLIEFALEHHKLKALLGVADSEKSVSPALVTRMSGPLMAARQNGDEASGFGRSVEKLLQKNHMLENITAGRDMTLALRGGDGKVTFMPLDEIFKHLNVKTWDAAGADQLWSMLQQSARDYQQEYGDRYLLELSYQRINPLSYAIFMVLLAIAAYTLLRKQLAGTALTLMTITIELVAVTWRGIIVGFTPLSNMYETVLFSAIGALIIAALLSVIKKDKLYVMAGLGYNLCCLFMLRFADGMLDSSIAPLAPVLRDQFWLSTHVTTITLSYAALALSWIIANFVIIHGLIYQVGSATRAYHNGVIYMCLKVGVVLLSAGIILGGVWADYAWGRFWGWDPKETWSLITLMLYLLILHLKHTNWLKPSSFAPCVAGAFLSVMMTWFGVNYLLATGLHSYGFSAGGALFSGCFFLAQIALLTAYVIKSRSQNEKPS